jgi:hypothetical protein
METHDLMGGKLHVYKRENSRYWQCSTYLAGKNRRMTTKEESLAHAKEIAEDWYLELRGKARAGQLASGPTFKRAVDTFLGEYEILTAGQRHPRYVENQKDRLRLYLFRSSETGSSPRSRLAWCKIIVSNDRRTAGAAGRLRGVRCKKR